MIDRGSELPVESAACSPKIVQEVGECVGNAGNGAGRIDKRSALIERRMLSRELPQKVRAKPEGMLAAHQTHGVLVLPVIGKPELRNVGGYAERGQTVAEAAIV